MTLHPANVLTLIATVLLLFAALHDIGLRTVPNWVAVALLGVGALLRVMDHRLLAGLLCGIVVFASATFCWWRGWMGGADVKLLGVTAVLVPPALVPGYIATVAFAGGVLALLYLVLEWLAPALRLRRPASFLSRILVVECRRIRRRLSVPYATAISAAAILILIRS